ncbi:N-acetylmuramic acid 6-phosphate etherase [candidate division KSB1 bacterium]
MDSNTSENKKLYDELESLATEQRNPASENIDTAPVSTILEIINKEDSQVHAAVERELPYIAKGVELIVETFRNGGRLFYIGAGTSGRLGVLDASECPPTFGTDPELVQGIIAGGYDSLIRSREGVEDIAEQGIEDLKERGFCSQDILCGLTASKRTPYVTGALEYAVQIGAKTIYVTCIPRTGITISTDVAICPVVGSEVIMGSTRMKAGTAEKMVLNMLTTASFIRMGKVYKNMMVDLQMTSRKLTERSKRIVIIATGVDYETASKKLEEAGGHVKTAILMILGNITKDEAGSLLDDSGGFVRTALDKTGNTWLNKQ